MESYRSTHLIAATTSMSVRRTGRGIVALMILRQLEELFAGRRQPQARPTGMHLLAEATKAAYASPRRGGSPRSRAGAGVDVEGFLSDSTGPRARRRPGSARPDSVLPGGSWHGGTHANQDTVYLCAVDRDGNALLVHQLAVLVVQQRHRRRRKAAVILQNRGAQFPHDPEVTPNAIAPRSDAVSLRSSRRCWSRTTRAVMPFMP